MAKINSEDLELLRTALIMHGGFVLDFNNNTFQQFVREKTKIDIYDDKYLDIGESKGKRLTVFLRKEPSKIVERLLIAFWEREERKLLLQETNFYKPENLIAKSLKKEGYFGIIDRITDDEETISTKNIFAHSLDDDWKSIVSSIESELSENKASVALDRIHTHCMKYFRFLLEKHGESVGEEETLNSRAGRYKNKIALKKKNEGKELHKMTAAILKNSISILELFNNVRNDHSPAHDNQLIDNEQARYIVRSIDAMLGFIREVEN